ncbi:hypothetical protein GDO86_002737 [Hymenochirus boettgeri]|uniref:Uncharacterized protein n=1 Tax=Hymenochirus boettgeri TaxID=247094 RepID=A0A8T2K489_9PIPI|nr:hypothetical protein GDO86_002737 [Hymenochirus boettgeri]
MATNIEQIFRSFVVNKFKEIQEEKLNSENTESSQNDEVIMDVSERPSEDQEPNPTAQGVEEMQSKSVQLEQPHSSALESDSAPKDLKNAEGSSSDEAKKEGSRKKSKKHKKHKSKKKKKKKKKEKSEKRSKSVSSVENQEISALEPASATLQKEDTRADTPKPESAVEKPPDTVAQSCGIVQEIDVDSVKEKQTIEKAYVDSDFFGPRCPNEIRDSSLVMDFPSLDLTVASSTNKPCDKTNQLDEIDKKKSTVNASSVTKQISSHSSSENELMLQQQCMVISQTEIVDLGSEKFDCINHKNIQQQTEITVCQHLDKNIRKSRSRSRSKSSSLSKVRSSEKHKSRSKSIVKIPKGRNLGSRSPDVDCHSHSSSGRRHKSHSSSVGPKRRSKSSTPVQRRRSSRTPVRHSKSPIRSWWSKSITKRERTRSISPVRRRRTRSKSTRRHKSRTKSPVRRRYSKARSPVRRRRSRSGAKRHKSRSRSASSKGKSRSRSASRRRQRSRSRSRRRKSLSVSASRRRSRSRSFTKKQRSRSRSFTRRRRSESGAAARRRRSRSGSAARRRRSRSGSAARRRRSRSGSAARRRRSRSGSAARRRRSRSGSAARRRRSWSASAARRRGSLVQPPGGEGQARRRKSRSESVARRKRSRSGSAVRRGRSRSVSLTRRRRSRSVARSRRDRRSSEADDRKPLVSNKRSEDSPEKSKQTDKTEVKQSSRQTSKENIVDTTPLQLFSENITAQPVSCSQTLSESLASSSIHHEKDQHSRVEMPKEQVKNNSDHQISSTESNSSTSTLAHESGQLLNESQFAPELYSVKSPCVATDESNQMAIPMELESCHSDSDKLSSAEEESLSAAFFQERICRDSDLGLIRRSDVKSHSSQTLISNEDKRCEDYLNIGKSSAGLSFKTEDTTAEQERQDILLNTTETLQLSESPKCSEQKKVDFSGKVTDHMWNPAVPLDTLVSGKTDRITVFSKSENLSENYDPIAVNVETMHLEKKMFAGNGDKILSVAEQQVTASVVHQSLKCTAANAESVLVDDGSPNLRTATKEEFDYGALKNKSVIQTPLFIEKSKSNILPVSTDNIDISGKKDKSECIPQSTRDMLIFSSDANDAISEKHCSEERIFVSPVSTSVIPDLEIIDSKAAEVTTETMQSAKVILYKKGTHNISLSTIAEQIQSPETSVSHETSITFKNVLYTGPHPSNSIAKSYSVDNNGQMVMSLKDDTDEQIKRDSFDCSKVSEKNLASSSKLGIVEGETGKSSEVHTNKTGKAGPNKPAGSTVSTEMYSFLHPYSTKHSFNKSAPDPEQDKNEIYTPRSTEEPTTPSLMSLQKSVIGEAPNSCENSHASQGQQNISNIYKINFSQKSTEEKHYYDSENPEKQLRSSPDVLDAQLLLQRQKETKKTMCTASGVEAEKSTLKTVETANDSRLNFSSSNTPDKDSECSCKTATAEITKESISVAQPKINSPATILNDNFNMMGTQKKYSETPCKNYTPRLSESKTSVGNLIKSNDVYTPESALPDVCSPSLQSLAKQKYAAEKNVKISKTDKDYAGMIPEADVFSKNLHLESADSLLNKAKKSKNEDTVSEPIKCSIDSESRHCTQSQTINNNTVTIGEKPRTSLNFKFSRTFKPLSISALHDSSDLAVSLGTEPSKGSNLSENQTTLSSSPAVQVPSKLPESSALLREPTLSSGLSVSEIKSVLEDPGTSSSTTVEADEHNSKMEPSSSNIAGKSAFPQLSNSLSKLGVKQRQYRSRSMAQESRSPSVDRVKSSRSPSKSALKGRHSKSTGRKRKSRSKSKNRKRNSPSKSKRRHSRSKSNIRRRLSRSKSSEKSRRSRSKSAVARMRRSRSRKSSLSRSPTWRKRSVSRSRSRSRPQSKSGHQRRYSRSSDRSLSKSPALHSRSRSRARWRHSKSYRRGRSSRSSSTARRNHSRSVSRRSRSLSGRNQRSKRLSKSTSPPPKKTQTKTTAFKHSMKSLIQKQLSQAKLQSSGNKSSKEQFLAAKAQLPSSNPDVKSRLPAPTLTRPQQHVSELPAETQWPVSELAAGTQWAIPDMAAAGHWAMPDMGAGAHWAMPDMGTGGQWAMPDLTSASQWQWPVSDLSSGAQWPVSNLASGTHWPVSELAAGTQWSIPDLAVGTHWHMPDLTSGVSMPELTGTPMPDLASAATSQMSQLTSGASVSDILPRASMPDLASTTPMQDIAPSLHVTELACFAPLPDLAPSNLPDMDAPPPPMFNLATSSVPMPDLAVSTAPMPDLAPAIPMPDLTPVAQGHTFLFVAEPFMSLPELNSDEQKADVNPEAACAKPIYFGQMAKPSDKSDQLLTTNQSVDPEPTIVTESPYPKTLALQEDTSDAENSLSATFGSSSGCDLLKESCSNFQQPLPDLTLITNNIQDASQLFPCQPQLTKSFSGLSDPFSMRLKDRSTLLYSESEDGQSYSHEDKQCTLPIAYPLPRDLGDTAGCNLQRKPEEYLSLSQTDNIGYRIENALVQTDTQRNIACVKLSDQAQTEGSLDRASQFLPVETHGIPDQPLRQNVLVALPVPNELYTSPCHSLVDDSCLVPRQPLLDEQIGLIVHPLHNESSASIVQVKDKLLISPDQPHEERNTLQSVPEKCTDTPEQSENTGAPSYDVLTESSLNFNRIQNVKSSVNLYTSLQAKTCINPDQPGGPHRNCLEESPDQNKETPENDHQPKSEERCLQSNSEEIRENSEDLKSKFCSNSNMQNSGKRFESRDHHLPREPTLKHVVPPPKEHTENIHFYAVSLGAKHEHSDQLLPNKSLPCPKKERDESAIQPLQKKWGFPDEYQLGKVVLKTESVADYSIKTLQDSLPTQSCDSFKEPLSPEHCKRSGEDNLSRDSVNTDLFLNAEHAKMTEEPLSLKPCHKQPDKFISTAQCPFPASIAVCSAIPKSPLPADLLIFEQTQVGEQCASSDISFSPMLSVQGNQHLSHASFSSSEQTKVVVLCSNPVTKSSPSSGNQKPTEDTNCPTSLESSTRHHLALSAERWESPERIMHITARVSPNIDQPTKPWESNNRTLPVEYRESPVLSSDCKKSTGEPSTILDKLDPTFHKPDTHADSDLTFLCATTDPSLSEESSITDQTLPNTECDGSLQPFNNAPSPSCNQPLPDQPCVGPNRRLTDELSIGSQKAFGDEQSAIPSEPITSGPCASTQQFLKSLGKTLTLLPSISGTEESLLLKPKGRSSDSLQNDSNSGPQISSEDYFATHQSQCHPCLDSQPVPPEESFCGQHTSRQYTLVDKNYGSPLSPQSEHTSISDAIQENEQQTTEPCITHHQNDQPSEKNLFDHMCSRPIRSLSDEPSIINEAPIISDSLTSVKPGQTVFCMESNITWHAQNIGTQNTQSDTSLNLVGKPLTDDLASSKSPNKNQSSDQLFSKEFASDDVTVQSKTERSVHDEPYDSEQLEVQHNLSDPALEQTVLHCQPPPELLPYDSEQPTVSYLSTSENLSEQASPIFNAPPELLPYDSDQPTVLHSTDLPKQTNESSAVRPPISISSAETSCQVILFDSVLRPPDLQQDCTSDSSQLSALMPENIQLNNEQHTDIAEPKNVCEQLEIEAETNSNTVLKSPVHIMVSSQIVSEDTEPVAIFSAKPMALEVLSDDHNDLKEVPLPVIPAYTTLSEPPSKTELPSVNNVSEQLPGTDSCLKPLTAASDLSMEPCYSSMQIDLKTDEAVSDRSLSVEKVSILEPQVTLNEFSAGEQVNALEKDNIIQSKESMILQSEASSKRSRSKSVTRRRSSPSDSTSKLRDSLPKSTTRKKCSRSKSESRRRSRSKSATQWKRSRSKSLARRRSHSKSVIKSKRARSKSESRRSRSKSTARRKRSCSNSRSVARKRRSRSRSLARKRRSRSPARKRRSRSRSARKRRSHSRSPVRKRRSRSKSAGHKRRSCSKSTGRKRFSRSTSTSRRRRSHSASDVRRRRSHSSSVTRRRKSRSLSGGRRKSSRSVSVVRRRRSRSISGARRRRSRTSSVTRRRQSRSASVARRRRSRSPSVAWRRRSHSGSVTRRRRSRTPSVTREDTLATICNP